MIVLHHVVAELLQTGERLLAHLAGEDGVDVVLGPSSSPSAGAVIGLPRDELLLRDHLGVVLCLLHVLGHEVERAEALPAPHALEDVLGLLLPPPQPHVLASHQLPGQRELLLQDVSGLARRRR